MYIRKEMKLHELRGYIHSWWLGQKREEKEEQLYR